MQNKAKQASKSLQKAKLVQTCAFYQDNENHANFLNFAALLCKSAHLMENIIRGQFGTRSGRVRDPFGTRSGRVRDPFGMRSGPARAMLLRGIEALLENSLPNMGVYAFWWEKWCFGNFSDSGYVVVWECKANATIFGV